MMLIDGEIEKTVIHYDVNQKQNAELYLCDCIEGIKKLPAEIVSAIVTSPPYNLNIKYSLYRDDTPRSEFLEWFERWVFQAERILATDGSLFLNVGGSPKDQWLPIQIAEIVKKKLVLQNTIHWIKSIAIDAEHAEKHSKNKETLCFGHYKPINSKRYINDCHEYIFHFTKMGVVNLNRRAVGVPYQHKSNISRWKSSGVDCRCRGNVWFIPYETILSREKDRPHPATFPVKLAEMCLKLHGIERITLCMDPFMGLGSSAIAAAKRGIDFLGFEIDPAYYLRPRSVCISLLTRKIKADFVNWQ